jgi:magnesium transporter
MTSKLLSRHTHLDDQLLEKLQGAFEMENEGEFHHVLARITEEYTPIDLAYSASHLHQEDRIVIYRHLNDFETRVLFLQHAEHTTLSCVLKSLDDMQLLKILEAVTPQRAVRFLDVFDDTHKNHLLELLNPRKSTRIRQIAQYPENSAGQLMSNEFFAFLKDQSVGTASEMVRNSPSFPLGKHIFIIDEKGALLGKVPTRSLLVNPPEVELHQVVQPILYRVSPYARSDEIVSIFERYQLSDLPVIDEHSILIGIITSIEVFEILNDIVDETIATIAGTDEDLSAGDPISSRYFARVPWLLATACGGLISMKVQSSFEWFFPSLIFFISLITGLSGSIGLQCSTVLLRELTPGTLSLRNQWKMIHGELIIGALIGVTFGIFCGGIVYLAQSFGFLPHVETTPLTFAIIVAGGLSVACLNATLLGVLSPLLFARIGVNPAVASGPIVTTFNDVSAAIIYYGVARLLANLWL